MQVLYGYGWEKSENRRREIQKYQAQITVIAETEGRLSRWQVGDEYQR
jgi:hypothetical protein